MVKIFEGYPALNVYVIESKKELEEILEDVFSSTVRKLTEEDIRNALQEAKRMFLDKTDLIKMLFTKNGLSILFSTPKTAIKFAFSKRKNGLIE